jgi:hypothetical protein
MLLFILGAIKTFVTLFVSLLVLSRIQLASD